MFLSTRVLPCALLLPALFFLPESPRWLAKMGMTEEFQTALQVLRGFDTDISFEVNEIKIGIGLLILQQLSGINAVLFYSNTIFQNAGISSSDVATFGVGAVQVLATCVTLWLADNAGRRILLLVSSGAMTLSLLVVSISFYVKDYVSEDSSLHGILSILSVVGVVVMVIAFSLGLGAIPWIIMSEILPVNIKSLAGSVATLANWLFSWLVTLTANMLFSKSSGGTFTIYTVVCALTVGFVAIWVPETKGKTLEEIQFLDILYYEFLYGVRPFEAKEHSDTYRRMVQVDIKFPPQPIVSSATKDLISQMLVKDSTQRLPLHKLLEHPWIVQNAEPSGVYRR
ncbi:hypothetical protein TanjilG_22743 [Lupinus angustifolius]|uniref:Major facilitator superfamily (MFS) profile domain-containing protein n=1 Tax=Lupinus angustifolius TaxID=3871 RepID=A0A4P1REK3_LUPAN|nr:hypothetical protein TanjilG_22743 [Lupinus angustifolius]